MRENSNMTIDGKVMRLVPYRPEHVDVYHQWMQDPGLQQATASEPLTLEEEYEMQRAWAADSDKLTFILLDKTLPGTPMAGDVNLFFNMEDDRSSGEIEIMVAEEASRRKGLAQEALTLFMVYAHDKLGVNRFVAKVGDANAASLKLFEKLGYTRTNYVEVFKEVHFQFAIETSNPDGLRQLEEARQSMVYGTYDQ